jgi:hypothetical protein
VWIGRLLRRRSICARPLVNGFAENAPSIVTVVSAPSARGAQRCTARAFDREPLHTRRALGDEGFVDNGRQLGAILAAAIQIVSAI